MTALSNIGIHLRQHRQRRGMSQLALASAAESTSRYISFIETGRARPGKEVVLRLAGSLNLTPRESNELLIAAGLPVLFPEVSFEQVEMEPVRKVIKQVLEKHDPFPAWVIGPGLRFLDSNQGAERVFPGMVGMEPTQLIDLWCSPSDYVPESQRAYIVQQTLQGLKHEAFHHPHPEIPALVKQLEVYAAEFKELPLIAESAVMFPAILVEGQEVRTLSTVMRFDKVVNVAMSEIRVELVFPADEESEAIFRSFKI
ncbi:MAG: helix-turn-helix domain-containing protein [Kangiellaceae bacterium]|nr:helix-turn-helix domain-containing protein [Kangiellaceae bacterium]